VGECAYWCSIDKDEWCDLTNSKCACGGSSSKCPLGNAAVTAAILEAQQMTLAEAALRARRRRSMREAS